MARKSTTMLTFLLPFLIAAGPVLGSDLMLKRPVRVLPNQVPTVISHQKALHSTQHLMASPGTVLDSTYYDWQRNGGLDDHLDMYNDGSTVKINGTMMVAYMSDTSDRNMNYYHWNGSIWDQGAGLAVFPQKAGFGSMSQFNDGRAAICAHTDDGTGFRAFAAFDAFIGLRAFSYFGTDIPSALIWPRISVNSDQSISMTGVDQGNYDVSVCRATDSNSGFGPWLAIRTLAGDWMDGDMEWPTIASGTNGHVGIVIPDVAGAIRLFESTDNGVNWTVTTIADADTAGAPAGMDSTAARLGWINSDIMYIGDEPHVAWTAAQVTNIGGGAYSLYDYKATIFHWSPSTGIDTVVVAWAQSADSTRSDYVPSPYNHMSVDWPSLGVAKDGSTIALAFTGLNTDDIDSTALPPTAYVDIYLTYSMDNGETWADPINVTNNDGTNLGWDDRYPSLAKTNYENGADPDPTHDVWMIYESDDLAGTYIQGVEGSLNMDYVKFTGVDIPGTGIGGRGGTSGPGLPRAAALSQNYPNPFNPSTAIRYQVPERSHVSIEIYDVRGRLVQTLINEEKDAGNYSVQWNGKTSNGSHVSSGIYFYTMKTDHNFKSTKKMVVLK